MKKILIIALGIFLLQNSFAQVKIDRTKKPQAGPAPKISIKDPVIFNMPNGMTVLVVENHKLPKVSATLNIDAGPILEGKKAGVMELMGEMLGEGTTSMTKEKFDQAVDNIGARVNLYSAGGSASALTRYFDKAFMLFADALKNPAFPEESFKKLQTQTITGLKSNEKSASAIANRVYSALSYGKHTAMGEFMTEESVKALTLNDTKEAYRNYITPSRSYLTFVGDITPAAAKTLAEKAFANWTGKKLTLPVIADAENPGKTEIDIVDVPTAVQGEMRVGNLIRNPLNGTDYHALALANHILGGGAESKLFMDLREKHGFTYGSYSRVGSGRFQNAFTATAAVRTDKVDSAAASMIDEIIQMRDGKITEDELSRAKAVYNGSFALGMENPATAANYAYNILINNLPKDFYRNFLEKINSLTIADIQRVSKKYFNEDRSRIVIVGNAKKIIPNLARLGYPIKKYDRYAEPVVDEVKNVNASETAKTSDAVSSYAIIEDYLKAIGGKDEVKKVNTIAADISMSMMGRDFTGRDLHMNPNKSMSEIKMGAMTVFKSVFNGLTGFQQQGPNKKEMGPEEIKEQQDDRGVIPQLFYNASDYTTSYLGKGKIDNEETYRLKILMPSGRTSIQQYSMKTGLLLQEETTSKQGDTEIPSIVEYKNYQKFGNILFPTQVVRNAGGQEITINYSNIKINEGVSESDFK